MKKQITKLRNGILVFMMTSLAGFSANADDTEIFFGGLADSNVQPNVLFILDNSGSMDTTDSGQTESRMDMMKSAMTQLLQNMNNVNVGIMQYSYPGGAVLYPVTDIDQTQSDAAPLVMTITSGDNDVEEATATGTVTTDNIRLSMTERSSTGNNSISTAVSASTDDTEEFTTSGAINRINSGSLELPIDDLSTDENLSHVVGTIFRSLAIPDGATIVSAYLDFAIEQNTGSDALDEPLNLEISGELYDTAAGDTTIDTFSATDNIASRIPTTNTVTWNITNPTGDIGDIETTPNLVAIIQEIVDQDDWDDGDDIALFLKRPSGDTSTGARVFASFDEGTLPAPTLRIVYEDPITTQTQIVGLRYDSVNIPQGATITGAALEFTSASDYTGSITYNIYGDAAANSTVATTADNLSGRTSTTNTVSWTPDDWEIDQTYTSADVTSVIQDIVDNGSWCGGNALTLMLSKIGAGEDRFVQSYENAPGKAPKLRVTYTASSPGCVASDLSYQIANSTSDGDGQTSGRGDNDLTDDKVIIGDNSGDARIGGFRFSNIQLPQGATIQNAYIELTAYETDSSTANFTIHAQDSDNANSLCTRTRRGSCDLKDKSYLGSSVSWGSVPAWTQGVSYRTPNISTLVQTIVNKAGWDSGNAMLFALRGSGTRKAVAYDDTAISSARLVIGYQATSTGTSNSVRQNMISLVQDMQPEIYTPIVDSLYEAAMYFQGGSVQWGDKRYHELPRRGGTDSFRYLRISHEDSYTGGTVSWPSGCTENDLNNSNCIDQEITGSPVYSSPITSQCQTNHIVLLTDGEPTNNDSVSLIESMLSNNATCTDDPIADTDNDKCATELAQEISTVDQSSSLLHDQFVTTHTIAFALNSAEGTGFLQDIAAAGGGSYKTASDANDLINAFSQILGSISQTDTTFVSPGVTVNTFNRLTHRNEIYYALFSPESTPSWPGNLKRYAINSSGTILDTNSNDAIDPTTGYFKDSAQSYWSASADGSAAEKGGAAEKLPGSGSRDVYTYYSGSSTTTLSNSANAFSSTNTANVTKGMMGISAESDTYHTNLINWARGLDPVTGLERKRLADPLHSVPHLVTYGGTDAAPELTIFYGDNEGFLHAIDATTGEEEFAFIPEELLPNLNTVYVNDQIDSHPYGIDGPVNSWVHDVDGDSQIEPGDGDHVYIYFGMRRGGRSYYALDVTDLDNPVFLWRIEGGVGDFTELGQTWSKPIKTKIDINGTITEVLIFAGGYDADQDNTDIIAADDVGRAIYIVNAATGAKIWSAGISGETENFSDMQYSIPGTIRVIDINQDKLADQMYIGDVGGQLWRFDIENGNTVNSLITGAVIADISGTTAASARRFYHEPDVSTIVENNRRLLAIAIGSGYRAHPLSEETDDRMYLFKQSDIYDAPEDGPDGGTYPDYVKLTESNLYNATDNLVQSSDNSTSSAALAALEAAEGWFIELEATGEKMISTPLTVSGKIFFTTYSPEINTVGCVPSNGTSRLYRVNALDAGVPPKTNDDGTVVYETDPSDRYETLKTVGLPADPVRLRIDGSDILCVGTECDPLDETQSIIKTYWYTEHE